MALPLAGNDLARSTSGRGSWASSTRRSFAASGSFREAWQTPPDVFSRSGQQREHDDEEELRWDAIERLPAYDRLRKCMLQQVLDDGQVVHGEVIPRTSSVDVQNL
ncbi:ABC transporter G family member 34-like [Punica granatum]|uniref:ABC transporter G family member 34-like n=1 Tax=Punica granatum TaxID=22663 RepID=A0A6P8CHQ2_PUNGR|nr:ABC transporter G family member 34-like [Punica granatum]